MRYFEDIEVGEMAEFGSHTFTAEEIVTFASRWDPQAFHVEDEAARRGPFGAITASGWHTACVWMRLHVLHLNETRAARQASGHPVPRFGASPGFRDMEWRRPVFVGDTLTYTSRVVDKRTLASYPDWGLVISRNEGTNQRDELAFAFTSQVFVERRAHQPAAGR
jgi:acyl dehydratase